METGDGRAGSLFLLLFMQEMSWGVQIAGMIFQTGSRV